MATKTTGKEFKEFYNTTNFWDDGVYHEEEEVSIDGVLVSESFDYSNVADSALMSISGGFVTDENGAELGTFEGYFRKWKKAQNTTYLVVSVQKELTDIVKNAILASGGKIVK